MRKILFLFKGRFDYSRILEPVHLPLQRPYLYYSKILASLRSFITINTFCCERHYSPKHIMFCSFFNIIIVQSEIGSSIICVKWFYVSKFYSKISVFPSRTSLHSAIIFSASFKLLSLFSSYFSFYMAYLFQF